MGETGESLAVNLYGFGLYTAVYSVGGQCLRLSKHIAIDAAIDADFTFEPVCFGEAIVFENISFIPEDATVDWLWNFGDGSSSTDENPTHLFDAAGTYLVELIGSGLGICADTARYEVIIYPLPNAAIAFIADGISSEDGSTGGCILNPVLFNDISTIAAPSSIIAWNWSFGDGITSVIENPTHLYAAVGTYSVTLTVTSEFGCSSTTTRNIIMTKGLDLDMIFNEPTCFDFSDGSITIDVGGGLDDLIFEITDQDGNLLNKDNSNTANALPTGWYYFNVSDGSACDASDSLFLDQPNEIELNLTRKNPSCYGIEDGWVRVDSVLNATGSYGGISYSWNPNPADIGGVSADSSFNMGAGDYTLTVNDENGCTQIADFKLTQPDSLFFNQFAYEPAYCRIADYQSGNAVIFGSATGGVSPYVYEWTELATGATHPNTTWGGRNPGEYKLVVTDANGCVHDRIIKVDSLNPIAGFEMTSPEFTSNYKGTAPVNVHFVNTSVHYANLISPSGEPTFFWNFDTVNAPWTLTHNVLEEFDTIYHARGQTYEVEVCLIAINKNGCKDTTCKKITIYEPIVFTPINVFTPNNDGVNDLFSFEYKSASIKQFTCIIVNRWGVTVHEMNAITDSWDGTDSNGITCKDGTYFYSYSALTDNGTKLEGQGNVQLIGGE